MPSTIPLVVIALIAAIVNGALGYGFSSIAVPLALLVVGNRMLNPALVLIELALNGYALWVNRDALSTVRKRAGFVVLGLMPGVAVGTAVLTRVDAAELKLITFATLLPFILLQVAGVRRAIRAERTAGIAFGAGVGALYATTTISGPPLAMFLANQGYGKREFRAGLALIRVAESSFAAVLYGRVRLFTASNVSLAVAMLPAVLIGLPLGAMLIRRVPEDAFRRACMSFDACIVALGLSMLLHTLRIVDGAAAYAPCAVTAIVVALVLHRSARRDVAPSAAPPSTSTPTVCPRAPVP
jgi:hypothetical protein